MRKWLDLLKFGWNRAGCVLREQQGISTVELILVLVENYLISYSL